MPNFLEKQGASKESLINYHNLAGYSQEHVNTYFRLLNESVTHNKDLIDSVIQNSGGKITFPMETIYLENYLDGYNFNYVPFNNILAKMMNTEGYFEIDKINRQNITIFYNTNCQSKKQRFTKIHEIMHFCQYLDLEFLAVVDDLFDNQNFPAELIYKLVDKSADKATAIYLMPNDYFIKKYQETQNVQELSDYFQVSVPSIMYRLKECGLIASY